MSFSTQKLHFSIKIPIQNYKQPSQTFTNDRTKSPQTTEKLKKFGQFNIKNPAKVKLDGVLFYSD